MADTPEPPNGLEQLRRVLLRFATDEPFAATIDGISGMASPFGGASVADDAERAMAVIDAMTTEERRSPEIATQRRRGEIAVTAGVAVDLVDSVLEFAARLSDQADSLRTTRWGSCEPRDLFSPPPEPPAPWNPRG
ncbi:hypothetical protein [Posidoniimonas polymericola]|uniref:hypothetical protein n=1 Tax=Posidoniimonas polymericola TaxID=2528002 RepID=UPI0011B446BE|nr:hypothetical protein [Posidoniimonas polymericola]